MKLVWSPLAIERVEEIADYISADRPRAAQKWLLDLFELAEKLGEFPEMGRAVPGFNNQPYKEIIFNNYRIIYSLDKYQINILTVRHFKQILPIEEIEN